MAKGRSEDGVYRIITWIPIERSRTVATGDEHGTRQAAVSRRGGSRVNPPDAGAIPNLREEKTRRRREEACASKENRVRGARRIGDDAGREHTQPGGRRWRSAFRGWSRRWRGRAWLRGAPFRRTPLRGAPFRRTPLRGAPFRRTPLRGAPLRVLACLPLLRALLCALLRGSQLLVLLPELRRVLPKRSELPGGVGAGPGRMSGFLATSTPSARFAFVTPADV